MSGADVERNHARMFLAELVRALVVREGDAIHLAPMLPPTMFQQGEAVALASTALGRIHTSVIAMAIIPASMLKEFELNKKCIFEIAGADIGLEHVPNLLVNIWRIQDDVSLTIEQPLRKEAS